MQIDEAMAFVVPGDSFFFGFCLLLFGLRLPFVIFHEKRHHVPKVCLGILEIIALFFFSFHLLHDVRFMLN